jgi:hypothetical protein
MEEKKNELVQHHNEHPFRPHVTGLANLAEKRAFGFSILDSGSLSKVHFDFASQYILLIIRQTYCETG